MFETFFNGWFTGHGAFSNDLNTSFDTAQNECEADQEICETYCLQLR